VNDKLIIDRPLVAAMPTHFGGPSQPIKPWQKQLFSFMKTRRGVTKRSIAIADPKGHMGKNSFFEDLLNPSLHDMIGIVWRNKSDFKNIIELVTISEEDEEEGNEPRLDFIWIDMTRSGDKRISDPSWYRDFEMLLNGSFLDGGGWGELSPHICVTSNDYLDASMLSGGRILQHLIHRDTEDLRFIEDTAQVEVLHDEKAIIYSRKTEQMHKHKPLEQLWIEHLYCNEGGEEKSINTTQMMTELVSKDPTLFVAFRAKGQSHRVGPKGKESFVKLIRKHAPQLRMTTSGSTVKFKVMRAP